MTTDSQAIIDFKLRALELKKAGDVEGAKALLAQARDVEFQGIVSAKDIDDILSLKRLAVALKRRGDLDGARDALAKAKRLGSTPEGATVAVDNQREQEQFVALRTETTNDPQQFVSTKHNTTNDNSTVNREEGENTEAAAEFTDEEMLDSETLVLFKQSGMDVPSAEDYQAKILASKKVALLHKQKGDIENAKAALSRAKRFEAVMIILNKGDESDDELNEEDEAWLTKELNQNDSVMFDESIIFGDEEGFSLDDLDDIDAEMLQIMIDSGIDVPTADDIVDMSKEKKALAVGLKQDGNLVGAKAALVESKRLQSRAERLRDLLEEIAKGGDTNDDEAGIEDLEKLLIPSNATKLVPERKSRVKSADELKEEVLKFRSENKIKEATMVFKLYKEALAREAEAAELEKREKVVSSLCEEITTGREQERLFLFYERFIDSEVGALQLTQWREYAKKCSEAVKMVETNGSDSVDLTRSNAVSNMQKIVNSDVDAFVGSNVDPNDGRLEVGLLSVFDLQENKIYKSIQKEATKNGMDVELSLRVDAVIQLPPNEKNTDEHITLSFAPPLQSSPNKKSIKFDFGPSQFVDFPRGTSAYAKIIQRRLSRKKVQFLVYHDPVADATKPSGWLKSWSNKQPEKEPVLLGRVVLELKSFLKGNSIAGDYSLTDSGRKELGGVLRVGLQVGAPYEHADDATTAADSAVGSRTAVDMNHFLPMVLTAGVC